MRKSTRFLKRHIISSDTHAFVGRIFDLSVIAYHFETYDELCKFKDAKYAFDVNQWISLLVRRVESLNGISDMLWLTKEAMAIDTWPISRFDWLNVCVDAFLMRIVSVIDGALILTNEVYEVGLDEKRCSISNLRKADISPNVIGSLALISDELTHLKEERNYRFHRGVERSLSSDDDAFRFAALLEHRGGGKITGTDKHGNKVNSSVYFKEGLVELQRDFNVSARKLERALRNLYDHLHLEFEARFHIKYNDADTSFGFRTRAQSLA